MKHITVLTIAALCGFSAAAAQERLGKEFAVWQEPLTAMQFVALPKGCFQMGSAEQLRPKADFIWEHLGYRGHLAEDEMPRHEVCLDAFWIGQHEVTAQVWLKVMGQAPAFGVGDEPAAGVTWQEALLFARRLSDLAGGGQQYRLPTEAQWEYACNAGEKTPVQRQMGKKIEGAWYSAWSRDEGQQSVKPKAVGQLAANPWGLHDMLGNVWEWTADGYRADAYARHALFNPFTSEAVSSANTHVIRGASHRSEYLQVRCSVRSQLSADAGLPQVGLRLVRVVGQP